MNRPTDIHGHLSIYSEKTGAELGRVEAWGKAPMKALRCAGCDGAAAEQIFASVQAAIEWISANPAVPEPGAERNDIQQYGNTWIKIVAALPNGVKFSLSLATEKQREISVSSDAAGFIGTIRRTAKSWRFDTKIHGERIGQNFKKAGDAVISAIEHARGRVETAGWTSGHDRLAWQNMERLIDDEHECFDSFVEHIAASLTDAGNKASQTILCLP